MKLFVFRIKQFKYGEHVVGVVWDNEEEARQLALDEINGAQCYTIYELEVPANTPIGVAFQGGYVV